MSTTELELLRDKALKGGSEQRLELLRFIRRMKLREPRMVLEFGPKVSEKYSADVRCYLNCDLNRIERSKGRCDGRV